MADSRNDDKYIRTFAKDAAMLSGQPEPISGAGVDQNLSVPTDRDSVLERLRSRAAKDPITEGQLLPDTLPTPVAIPENKDAPVQIPERQNEPQEATPWKPGDLPTYAPQAPIPTVYRESVPDVTPLPNIEPVIEAPDVLPVPSPSPSPILDESPSPLHTYKTDFSDRIDTEKASTFSVLAAQSDAAGAPTPPQTTQAPSRKSVFIIVSGILLLVIATGGSYAVYRYVSKKSFVPNIQTVSSLVFADERVELTSEGGELQRVLLASLAKPLPEKKVRVFYTTESTSTSEGGVVTTILPGGRVLGALQLRAPDLLLRNIAPESTVGAITARNETRIFFILRVLSYERTFAGMLSWEGTMADELSAFYPGFTAPPPPPTVITTTKIIKGKRVISTSTVETPAPPYIPPQFTDEIASNHNVRVLKDSYGNTILLYGYRDKSTLIIARNEAAFAELINRLSATKQQ